MITEDYVSYEVAKLLKERGFDEPIQYFYKFDSKELYRGTVFTNTQIGDKFYNAPTHQMAMKWLREIYGIDIVIEISDPSVKDRKYYCIIWDDNNNSYILDLFNSYEDAVEAVLKYVLENLLTFKIKEEN